MRAEGGGEQPLGKMEDFCEREVKVLRFCSTHRFQVTLTGRINDIILQKKKLRLRESSLFPNFELSQEAFKPISWPTGVFSLT